MNKISIKLIENHFGIIFILAITLSFFFPQLGVFLFPYVSFILILILYFTFFKIQFTDILFHIKKPLNIVYILVVYLLVIPSFTFLIVKQIDPVLGIGFLLLTSMPAGVTSPTLTDLLKGNGSLSLTLVVISHLIVPFSAPFLLYYFTAHHFYLDVNGIMINLAIIILLPLILSTITKKITAKMVNNIQPYVSTINILLLAILIYTIVATNSQRIITNIDDILLSILCLYILYVFLHIIGSIIVFWKDKKDKIAVACSKVYLNDALALVIAAKFFRPEIGILMVLSILTRNTMPLFSKCFFKYLK